MDTPNRENAKLTISNKDNSIVKYASNSIDAKKIAAQLSAVFDEEFEIGLILNHRDDLWARCYDR